MKCETGPLGKLSPLRDEMQTHKNNISGRRYTHQKDVGQTEDLKEWKSSASDWRLAAVEDVVQLQSETAVTA